MRAVIYARYSSDLQSACSIEDQVRLYRYRIEAEGWSLVNTYTDPALSGASRLRSGYQKLLEDARGVSTSSWRKHVGLKGTMTALFLKDLAMKTRGGPGRPGAAGALRRRPLLRLPDGARDRRR